MRRSSFFVLCAACLALTLSTGCGDDEDPKPDAGPYVPPVVDSGPPDAGPPDAGPSDLIPPVVVLTSPTDGAQDVPLASRIEVTFSEPMQTDRGTLQLLPGTGLPNGGVFSARPENWDFTRRKVSFLVPQGLPRKAALTANVGNFADVAGNPMAELFTFRFTVTEGPPPHVSSTAPVEGASGDLLGTKEIVINFDEPMDVGVGKLEPGEGLTLGPIKWEGNQSLSAPITSTLLNNRSYSVRLDGFRNIHGKALDGSAYLGDGKLDFSTGADTLAPKVVDSSPKENAQGVKHENTVFIVFTFSEPMDTQAGKAELVDGSNPRVTLSPEWSADGFTVRYRAQHILRPTAALRVDLQGFRDRSNNPLDLSTSGYLGTNGALDFTMAADSVKPYVTATNIPDDPNGVSRVYPLEVYAQGVTPAYRKVFTFQFIEPMDPAVSDVKLYEVASSNPPRTFTGQWSTDRLTLTVTVESPGLHPLLGDRSYYLDLTSLRDPSGNLLDTAAPPLGNGKLEFTTDYDRPDLNHACGHVLTQKAVLRNADGSQSASAPYADQLHVHYEVFLPPDGNSLFSGYARARLTTNQTQPIFLSRNVPLAVIDPGAPGTHIPVYLEPVPPACAELTHFAWFGTPLAQEVYLQFGPLGTQAFHMVLEPTY